MHVVLALSSLLLVLMGSFLMLYLLGRVTDWSHRRLLQVLVLTMPLIALVFSTSNLHHLLRCSCLQGTPFWEILFGIAYPLSMGFVMLSALGIGFLRLRLLTHVVTRGKRTADADLQRRAEQIGTACDIPASFISVYRSQHPLALTYGLWKPRVVISTWMLEQLDAQELEAVLLHEYMHVLRRDYLVIWLATILRDGFFYMPTSQTVYRQLQQEKEMACDEAVVGITHRPLALASALTKVWLHIVDAPPFTSIGTAQLLDKTVTEFDERIGRLLAHPQRQKPSERHCVILPGVSIILVLLVIFGQMMMHLSLLALMRCQPPFFLWKLF